MADAGGTVNARIVYWGAAGAGVSTTLEAIRSKVRGGSELRRVPTRLDPTVRYEVLPISLGVVGGVQTELQIVGVPADPDQAPTRKQLLDQVDGLVFVADAAPHRLDDNLAALAELKNLLAAYGRDTGNLPFVIQYNKRDLADPYAIEALHRKIGIPGAAVFESIATQRQGVLQALTTVSKQVIRLRRDRVVRAPDPAPVLDEAEVIEAADVLTPDDSFDDRKVLEAAILAEAENEANAEPATAEGALFDRSWDELADEAKSEAGAHIGRDFEIVSVGTATRSGTRAVRVPLVLGNAAGETVSVALSIALDPMLDASEE